nr:hypothetical protein [Trinickia mobilis]
MQRQKNESSFLVYRTPLWPFDLKAWRRLSKVVKADQSTKPAPGVHQLNAEIYSGPRKGAAGLAAQQTLSHCGDIKHIQQKRMAVWIAAFGPECHDCGWQIHYF